MIRTTRIAIALFLLSAGGSAFAQTKGLSVAKGTTYGYAVSTEGKMTQVVNGQENSNDMKSSETVKLTPTKIGKDRIEWDCLVVDGGAAAQKTKPVPQKLITDAAGTVLDLIGGANGSSLTQGAMKANVSMKVGSPKSRLRRYFLPQLTSGAKPGDSWDDVSDDTTVAAQMGLKIIAHTTMHYQFEGYADTLGTKLARVRWASTGIDLSGDMKASGMNMSMAGDGSTSGVSYFSTTDGMLVARTEALEAHIRVSVQDMVIPIVQQQKSTVIRLKS